MSSSGEYANLARTIGNWPMYLLHKFQRGRPNEYRFITRRRRIPFVVPGALRGTFKEVFMADTYDLRTLFDSLPENPTVIDIGANIGLFSVAMVDGVPGARCFAYEPHPGNFVYLERNAEAAQQIFPHPMAVAAPDSPDILTLHFDAEEFGTRNHESVEVPATSLDAIVEHHAIGRIDLLKLDCEGAEYDILYGASSDTVDRIRQIVMETHDLDDDKRNVRALARFLSARGLLVSAKPRGDGTALVRARREDA